jgi:hypothetical protein
MLHEDLDVEAYKEAVNLVSQRSLSPEASFAIIEEFATRLDRNHDT